MFLPEHTLNVLFFYIHACIVIILNYNFSGITVYYHTFILSILTYLPGMNRLVLTSYCLWLSWNIQHNMVKIIIFNSKLLSLFCNILAIVSTLIMTQLTRNMQKTWKSEKQIKVVLVTSIFSVILMIVTSQTQTCSMVEQQIRTITFMILTWIFQMAVKQSKILNISILELVSLVISFSVLTIPLPLTFIVLVSSIIFIYSNGRSFLQERVQVLEDK